MSPSRFWLAALFVTAVYTPAFADLRVLPQAERPKDARLQPLKDLDGYFPFTPPTDAEAWKKRADEVRSQLRVALGLVPEPSRTPLNAVIHGRVEREDYTVEKVFFESLPGFFVTGNLYRPKNASGRSPAVLCPHGHWPNGRFMEESDATVRRELASGAEKFENAARSPLQARCVQLARMGCVVFHYDMLGYADSLQISYDVAHKFAKQRPEMNTTTNWGLYSPQAESHAQSIMGLQTWNSIRSLDFLQSLPDVDPDRIGVTGASGGGTQTMLHAALDRRVTAAFPAVMVSTAMQGGCTCENASLLRVGTGNIEFAALFAPKPMAMTSANDWTKELETKGFPELKKLWSLLGSPDNVSMASLTQFPHNYNGPSRAAMYAWFNKHLRIGLPEEKLQERDFARLTREEMSVWNAEHPAPQGGADFERKLLKWWREDTDASLKKGRPADIRQAVQVALGTSWNDVGAVQFDEQSKQQVGGYQVAAGFLRDPNREASLPTLHLSSGKHGAATVLWLDERGKAGLFAGDNQLRPEVRALLDAGVNVIGVDLFQQGEFLAPGDSAEKTRRVKNPREAAAYTFGYNRSVFSQRTHDVLAALRFVHAGGTESQPVGIVALGSTGPIAAAARAISPECASAAALESADFRFVGVTDLHDPSFQPALARYGDLPGLLELCKPSPVRFIGSSPQAEASAALTDPNAAVLWLKDELQRTVKR